MALSVSACTEGLLAREKLERAQILYAIAGIAYAASLGLVTARAAFNPDGYVYGLAVVLTASYAQGLLIYVSVRPAIAMAQSVVPMLLAMPAALASPFFAYQLTAPMYLFPIMLCANACRLQSRLFFELFHSRHVLLREANSDALTGLSTGGASTSRSNGSVSTRCWRSSIWISMASRSSTTGSATRPAT